MNRWGWLGAALLVTGLSGVAWSETATTESDAQALIEPEEIPSVHNTFYQVPDDAVGWNTLGNMDVTTEILGPLRTVFHVDYTDEVKALDAQDVKVMGFLYPLKGGVEHSHFLLTAWPPSCPFCLPAGPSQMVEVFAAEPVEFSEGAIMMGGTFRVLEDDPSGMYYRMDDARLVERF
ncbi:MAG: hypothetical protein AAF637_11770, partial [Pseudomonadota bacterium]